MTPLLAGDLLHGGETSDRLTVDTAASHAWPLYSLGGPNFPGTR